MFARLRVTKALFLDCFQDLVSWESSSTRRSSGDLVGPLREPKGCAGICCGAAGPSSDAHGTIRRGSFLHKMCRLPPFELRCTRCWHLYCIPGGGGGSLACLTSIRKKSRRSPKNSRRRSFHGSLHESPSRSVQNNDSRSKIAHITLLNEQRRGASRTQYLYMYLAEECLVLLLNQGADGCNDRNH